MHLSSLILIEQGHSGGRKRAIALDFRTMTVDCSYGSKESDKDGSRDRFFAHLKTQEWNRQLPGTIDTE